MLQFVVKKTLEHKIMVIFLSLQNGVCYQESLANLYSDLRMAAVANNFKGLLKSAMRLAECTLLT